VNWRAAIAAVEALGHSAGKNALPLLEPITRELLAPLCRIEEIAAFGARALAGDRRALKDLQNLTCQVMQSRPSSAGLFRMFAQSDVRSNEGAGGCCGHQDTGELGAPPAVLSSWC
jgi:hypothetical protein